jgi:hypothetical protein
MGSSIGSAIGNKEPKREDYEVRGQDDLLSRYLAIIDDHLVKRGLVPRIPEEARPYELRSPEERQDWRDRTGKPSGPGTINKPSLNDGMYFSEPPAPQAIPKNVRPVSAPSQYEEPSVGAIAPQAPTMGIVQPNQALPMANNSAFFEEDKRRKAEEFNRVKEFVYRDGRR